jgi:chemotaxis signal transduction protein
MAENLLEYLKFRYKDLSFALGLQCVERVIRAVALIRPSDLPPSVFGVFNYHETLVPLFTIYGKRQTELIEPDPDHLYILIRTPFRSIAILADNVDGIFRVDERDTIEARSVDAGFCADKVYTCCNDIVFIYDIEKFLDRDDEIQISRAIEMIQTSDCP